MKKKIFSIALLGFLSTLNAGVISQNGIAKDSVTGLMWQDEPITEAEKIAKKNDTNNGKVGNWNYAKAYCENLTLGGFSDWRLPNIYELTTLLDNTKSSEPFVINGIENIASNYYWSSTTNASRSAWYVHFYYGDDDWHDKTNSHYVRCVRAGQLNFDNLVILKNKGKLKVSQDEIDKISPNAEKIKAKKEAERKKQEAQEQSQKTSSFLTGYKIGTQTDHGDNISYDIACANGRNGSVNYYPNNASGSKYYGTSNGNMLDYGNRTFDEAINSICYK